MYKTYFGLTENPFSIAPDPRYLYMSEIHQEALAHLKYGEESDGCIILLTGEIGTGKTTICRFFLELLGKSTDIAIILNPKLTAVELLAAICDEFKISNGSSGLTVKNHIDRLNDYLLRVHAENRQVLLVLDEAQNLALDVLEMLRLLTNLETNRQKLLKILLLGQTELLSLLCRPELSQINQRITSRYHLKGLRRYDIETYINHRIEVAGGGRVRLFSKNAVKNIYALSGGIPRLINSLCDRCLLGAYTEGRERVSGKIVKKAAREVFGTTGNDGRRRSRFRMLSAGATLTACLLIGLWYSGRETMPPAAPSEQQSSNNPGVRLGEPDEVPAGNIVRVPAESAPAAERDQEYFQRSAEKAKQEESGPFKTTRIIIEPLEINK